MTTREVLIAARAKIADPEHWIKGAAFDASRNAHCAYGAVDAAAGWVPGVPLEATGFDRQGSRNARRALVSVTGEGLLTMWNDAPERTHAEVLAAFDKAIAEAGE